MNKNYYIQNMFWGWFIGGYILYLSWSDDSIYKAFFLIIAIVGIILYPLSKWIIERFFLKFTTKEFWNRGLFIDTPGKMGLLAIYSGFSFILAIPIVLISTLYFLIKRLIK